MYPLTDDQRELQHRAREPAICISKPNAGTAASEMTTRAAPTALSK